MRPRRAIDFKVIGEESGREIFAAAFLYADVRMTICHDADCDSAAEFEPDLKIGKRLHQLEANETRQSF